MKKNAFKVMCILIIVLLFSIHTYININNRIKPPSEKWSKEVLITESNITTPPKIIKYKNKYLIAYNDGSNVKIRQTNDLGVTEKVTEIKSQFKNINNLNLITDGDNVYVSWLNYTSSSVKTFFVKLNKQLDIIDKSEDDSIKEIIQIGSSYFVWIDNNGISIYDAKLNKKLKLNVREPSMLAGTMTQGKAILTYVDLNSKVFCLSIDSNGITKPVKAAAIEEMSKIAFYSTALVTDEKYGYLIIGYSYENTPGNNRMVKFNLDGSGYSMKELREFTALNTVPGQMPNKPVFLSNVQTLFRNKYTHEDIVEYEIKDSKLVENNLVSRTNEATIYPASCGDTVLFCDSFKSNSYKLYMTSSRESFKKEYNGIEKNEIIQALNDTFQSFVYSIFDIIIYGSLWILPTICIVSIISLFEFRLNLNMRKIIYIISYLIAVLIKIFVIYSISYKRYSYFIPKWFTPLKGIIAAFIISTLCISYGYRKYTEDTSSNVLVFSLSKILILDTILTQMVFIPFII
ncbi:MAG: hypothetical protein K0R54_1479 [Clostridiaceae bacterium]|nr:hypothetical protein [Clostridiaceae bacterium]